MWIVKFKRNGSAFYQRINTTNLFSILAPRFGRTSYYGHRDTKTSCPCSSIFCRPLFGGESEENGSAIHRWKLFFLNLTIHKTWTFQSWTINQTPSNRYSSESMFWRKLSSGQFMCPVVKPGGKLPGGKIPYYPSDFQNSKSLRKKHF